jgi:ribonuclease HI
MSSDIRSAFAQGRKAQSPVSLPIRRIPVTHAHEVQSTALQDTLATAAPSSAVIVTAGRCVPNPGHGEWEVAIVTPDGQLQHYSGDDPHTTNNRMELKAAIVGLELLSRPCHVTLCTSSEYLALGVSSRLSEWMAAGWRTAKRKPVPNQDLWEQLYVAMQPHRVQVRKVPPAMSGALDTVAGRIALATREAAAARV